MIDPYDLTKPWDERRLQEWFLFGVCVAGKPARMTALKLDIFLSAPVLAGRPMTIWGQHLLPFDFVKKLIANRKLGQHLRKAKFGQYTRINKAMRGMVRIDPATVTLDELEQIHGVGAKTARMLLLYTRPDLDVAPLDTHVLKWLRANGYDAPKSTPPPGKKYRELEQAFLAEGKKRSLTAREWDTEVWLQYAKG